MENIIIITVCFAFVLFVLGVFVKHGKVGRILAQIFEVTIVILLIEAIIYVILWAL